MGTAYIKHKQTVKRITDVKLGLYRVYWSCGGSSLALISNDREGSRQMHCCNWVNTETVRLTDYIDSITCFEVIELHSSLTSGSH